MRLLQLSSLIALACAGLMAQDQPAPPPQGSSIPSGTQLRVRLGQTISSATAKSGDRWQGTLDADVLGSNGVMTARRGDPVEGRVVTSQASGRISGKAELQLELTSVNGQPVTTQMIEQTGQGRGGRTAKAAGGGAALGAIIGAIAGGGKGAAIGAGSGAAVGAGAGAATGKKDIKYLVESVITFSVR